MNMPCENAIETVEPIVRVKEMRDHGSVVEIVVWRIPQPCRRVRIHTSTACTSALGTAGCGTTTSAARATIDTLMVSSSHIASFRWRSCWTISSAMSKTGGDA
jgi:hypothetical protein